MKAGLKELILLSTAGTCALALTVRGQSSPTPQGVRSGIERANMDTTVRPQDDFYRHVNGTWLAKTELPAEKPSYGAFTQLADAAEVQIRELIEGAAAQADRQPGTVPQQVGDLYASFMNEARADALGMSPIQGHLDRVAAVQNVADLARLSGALATIGIGSIAGDYIEPDAKNPSENIVTFLQSGTALPEREYYLSTDPKYAAIRAQYVEYLTRVFTLAGQKTASADAAAVLALETELARAQWTPAESRDALKTYNKHAVASLNADFPGFDWAAWAKAQNLDRVADVVIGQPSFFKAAGTLAAQTPLDTWKAWLRARVINARGPLLSTAVVDAHFQFFDRTLSGVEAQRPRWKRAVALVNSSMPEAVGKLYVEKHFPPAAKARMQTMIANLVEAYRQSISSLDWMTPATRKEALSKLAKFTSKVGYPDRFRSYTGVLVKADDLLGNAERAIRFEADFQAAKLGKPVDRALWLLPPQEVNAYYNPIQNEIVFPAAILQPPFFNFEADDAVNYGGIGAVIGHEIGHGFDDQGRHYDGDGRLRDWWSKADETEFQRRAAMLVGQFNAFEPLPGLKLNGELTLGENIGDLGGLSIAFRAYLISLEGKRSPVVDGLTGEQRVFMGWTQAWRQKYRDEFLRVIVTSDPHAPSMYRGSNPLTNIEGFYEAFAVKAGDKMYRPPAERVRIW